MERGVRRVCLFGSPEDVALLMKSTLRCMLQFCFACYVSVVFFMKSDALVLDLNLPSWFQDGVHK